MKRLRKGYLRPLNRLIEWNALKGCIPSRSALKYAGHQMSLLFQKRQLTGVIENILLTLN